MLATGLNVNIYLIGAKMMATGLNGNIYLIGAKMLATGLNVNIYLIGAKMLATGLKRFWRKPPNPWGSARLPKYRQPVLLFHIVLPHFSTQGRKYFLSVPLVNNPY
jgi:hypothetical protein